MIRHYASPLSDSITDSSSSHYYLTDTVDRSRPLAHN